MSSDEDEPVPKRGSDRIFLIRKKPWRAAGVMALLRLMDGAHCTARAGGPGQPPRSREERDGLISQRAPVAGLPINFYNPEWLESLKRRNIIAYRALNVQPAVELPDLQTMQ